MASGSARYCLCTEYSEHLLEGGVVADIVHELLVEDVQDVLHARSASEPLRSSSLLVRPPHDIASWLGCCMRLVVRLVHEGRCLLHEALVVPVGRPLHASYFCCVVNVACGGLHATCFMPPVSCCA